MKECPECCRCFEDRERLCPDDGAALHLIFAGPCVLDHKYLLERGLGEGGMGTVYMARHLGLERAAAVKLLRPRLRERRRFEERFRQEARLLARLRHPHVVEVHDFGVDAERGLAYLVMEHLEGTSLAELTRTAAALPIERVLALAEQIASALDEAHGSGIIHCDLKPSNVILLRPSGLKVIDFGVARLLAEEAEAGAGSERSPGSPRGTPAYMAPELLARGSGSAASDIYAFGVILYELAVGQRPFEGSAAELAVRHATEEPRPPSELRQELDIALDSALLTALAKLPAERPATASAAVAGLREAWCRLERRRQRPRRLAASAAIALVAALLAVLADAPLARLENRLIDARFYLSPPRPPRHPILLVLIDDATLTDDPAPLTEMSDEAGELLAGVFRSGAAGVAIDLLLPASWSRSEPFADLVLRYPDRLRLAAYSTPSGEVIGPEVLGPLTTAVLGPELAADCFGYVNASPDTDGVVRRLQSFFLDLEGRPTPAFALQAARLLRESKPSEEPYWIDFRLDWRELPRLSWKDVAAMVERRPDRFRDHLVLVGGSYSGSGDEANPIPHPASMPGAVSGAVLQALAVHTLLDGRPVRAAARQYGVVLTVSMAAAGAAAALLAKRRRSAWISVLALVAAWPLAAHGLFLQNQLLLPIVTPIVAALLSASLGLMLAVLHRSEANGTLKPED